MSVIPDAPHVPHVTSKRRWFRRRWWTSCSLCDETWGPFPSYRTAWAAADGLMGRFYACPGRPRFRHEVTSAHLLTGDGVSDLTPYVTGFEERHDG